MSETETYAVLLTTGMKVIVPSVDKIEQRDGDLRFSGDGKLLAVFANGMWSHFRIDREHDLKTVQASADAWWKQYSDEADTNTILRNHIRAALAVCDEGDELARRAGTRTTQAFVHEKIAAILRAALSGKSNA